MFPEEVARGSDVSDSGSNSGSRPEIPPQSRSDTLPVLSIVNQAALNMGINYNPFDKSIISL